MDAASGKVEPARVEPVEGTDLNRLVLTAEAEQRLGIATDVAGERSVPESAVIYETTGETLVYTRTAPGVFVRHPVVVERISAGVAVLSDGPPAGAQVVTVGGSELFGIDFGIGK